MQPKVREAKRTSQIAVLTGFVVMGIFTADALAMYHPTLGRFMQRDPRVQYADGMNLYQYVGAILWWLSIPWAPNV